MQQHTEINPQAPSIDVDETVTDDTFVIDRVNGTNIEVKEETVAILQDIGSETGESLETVIENIKESVPLIISVNAVHKVIEGWGDGEPKLVDCIWGAAILEATLENITVENVNTEAYKWTQIHYREAKQLLDELEEMIQMYEELV